MRRRSRARKGAFPGGRNVLVERLARLAGLVVMMATIVPFALATDDAPAYRLLWCIVGGAAGQLSYGVVIKIYWRD